ncbi:MAG TPA: DUF4157 domain-containing protein [Pyrinomonadaceae bacterium]|nr:DUF4157 domain-containing protein [Pyrinomonadaceae bacterium]
MRKTSRPRTKNERTGLSSKGAGKQSSHRASSQLDRLQRQHGNRTVQKLYEAGYLNAIQRQAPEEQPREEEPMVCEEGPAAQTKIQTKLSLSSPADVQELEAERVANDVAKLHNAVSTSGLGASFLSQVSLPRVMGLMSGGQRSFHRTINAGRQLQISPSRTAQQSGGHEALSPEIERRIMQSRGNGQPLPKHVQNAMAISTGYDFSAVRVKTDSEAAALNQSTHARAFTLGNDIWLGKNESPNDLRLMAHELTHVVQQGAARPITTVSTAGADGKKKKSSTLDYLQGLARDKTHDPKVFTKAIDSFVASNPSDHIATFQRQVLERRDGTNINQKSDSTVMRACGCSGGPGGGTAAPCSIPTNFRETARSKAAGGVLHFEYDWDSSTGGKDKSDLSACEVGEHVAYTHTKDPPFAAAPNPTIRWHPATGPIEDNHSPGAKKPYEDFTETAVQNYRFHCPCHNSNKPTVLMGPITITREIKPKTGGGWRYKITKSGISNEIDPLP